MDLKSPAKHAILTMNVGVDAATTKTFRQYVIYFIGVQKNAKLIAIV